MNNEQLTDLGRQLLETSRALATLASTVFADVSGASPAEPTPRTAADKLRALFRSAPSRVWSLADLEAALPDVHEQTIRATVGRLCRAHDTIRQAGRGRFKLLNV
jgi:hypothetical protein